jgi:hypothetical protein
VGVDGGSIGDLFQYSYPLNGGKRATGISTWGFAASFYVDADIIAYLQDDRKLSSFPSLPLIDPALSLWSGKSFE